jgi:hypothetical protein
MRWLAVLTALTLSVQPMTANASCKVALAFALDISSSVDDAEYRLQIDGLANALVDERVIEAILTPEGAFINAAAYEWSGYQQQDMVLDWTVLDTPAAIRNFAARLSAHRRVYANFATAVGKGVEFGAQLLPRAPPCGRYVLDVSGDGQNNVGVGPDFFRKAGLLEGITINGLVIRGATPDPARYYEKYVLNGPDSFMVIANDFEDYTTAMTEKLLRELKAEMVLGRN